MKKSSRVLALLLCLVMVVALMPTFAISAAAEENINWQNSKIADTRILQFEKEFYSTGGGNSYELSVTIDRHDLRPESEIKKYDTSTFSDGEYQGMLGILDRGYSDSNIFLIPNGQGVQKYMIVRAQQNDYRGAKGTTDINRWWRWGTWVNDNEWVDSGENGMYARIYGPHNSTLGKVGWWEICKTNAKSSSNHWTWTGGDDGQGYHTKSGSRGAGRLYLHIDTNMPVGTKGVLWSANGTLEGTILELGSLREGAVEVGDRGTMTFSIAKRSTVIYRLDGGTWGGDTRDVGYYTWSTGDASTAQLHDIIQEPTREGYTFVGWECVKNGGNSKLAVGGIYQPYAVDQYNVTVHGDTDKGDYKIHSHDYDGKVEYGCLAITDDTEFKAVWVKNDFTIKHIQNGTEVSSETIDMTNYGKYEVVAYNQAKQYKPTTKLDITSKVTPGKLYGGTFTDEACTTPATAADLFNGGKAQSFDPKGGATYYIWEVSDEHLVPKNISVWSKQDGITDVKAVYLLTAIDREKYSAAGFKISAGAANQVSNEGKIAYEYINVWQNNKDYHYIDLYPAATTTASSLIQCCALTGFKDQPITVVPYWVTLDGVKVFGTTQRTITYKGSGTGTDYQSVDVTDTTYNGTRIMSNAVNSPAPMMLMARYSMVNEENFVDVGNLPEIPEEPDVPETAVVNVVDGDKAYEAEIVDGAVALTPAGADGKLFAGWFVDAACTAPAGLAAVSDGDTVYAKYVSASFLQVKYAAVFTLFNKSVSFAAAVADKNFAETGFVFETKNGTDTVVASSYTAKFALQNAQQLFGVAKDAPLMSVDYKLDGLSKGDTITVTPYWVTADGTTVYGTARTLTYNGLTVKG